MWKSYQFTFIGPTNHQTTPSPDHQNTKVSKVKASSNLTSKIDTPLKTNMEPRNHPFEKENHLPNLHYCVPCLLSRVYFGDPVRLFLGVLDVIYLAYKPMVEMFTFLSWNFPSMSERIRDASLIQDSVTTL